MNYMYLHSIDTSTCTVCIPYAYSLRNWPTASLNKLL